jgi:hypothetical protein
MNCAVGAAVAAMMAEGNDEKGREQISKETGSRRKTGVIQKQDRVWMKIGERREG